MLHWAENFFSSNIYVKAGLYIFCQFNNKFLVVDAIFDYITEFCCEGGRGLVEPGQSSATDPGELRWCRSPGTWKKLCHLTIIHWRALSSPKLWFCHLMAAIIDPLISPNIAIGHLSPFGKVKMKPPCLLPPCQCPSIMLPLENVWNWGLNRNHCWLGNMFKYL